MSARHEEPRCVAPVGGDDDRLCGEPAATTRIVAGLVCPLCEKHAAELDREEN